MVRLTKLIIKEGLRVEMVGHPEHGEWVIVKDRNGWIVK